MSRVAQRWHLKGQILNFEFRRILVGLRFDAIKVDSDVAMIEVARGVIVNGCACSSFRLEKTFLLVKHTNEVKLGSGTKHGCLMI